MLLLTSVGGNMSDLSIIIDNIKLNIRVGMIFKYHEKVLLEIPRISGGNSVIPGGRVKINELTLDALCRELKEELNFEIDKSKTIFQKTLEYFFEFEKVTYHEFFFVYEYMMNEEDYNKLTEIKENQDNHKTDFVFVKYDDFNKVNLLPLDVRGLIKE